MIDQLLELDTANWLDWNWEFIDTEYFHLGLSISITHTSHVCTHMLQSINVRTIKFKYRMLVEIAPKPKADSLFVYSLPSVLAFSA